MAILITSASWICSFRIVVSAKEHDDSLLHHAALLKTLCLTMDPVVGDFERADVLIEGSKISAVAPNLGDVADAFEIDATNTIVMPGFIDTHHHLYQSVFRNVISNGDRK